MPRAHPKDEAPRTLRFLEPAIKPVDVRISTDGGRDNITELAVLVGMLALLVSATLPPRSCLASTPPQGPGSPRS